MATTDEDLQQQDQEYSQAFAEPETEAQQVDEDAAFGLGPEETAPPPAPVAEDGSDHSAAVNDDPSGGEIASGELPETPAQEAAEPTGDDEDKELQRQRSWEGRLRAREEELAAREEALKALESGKTGEEPPAKEAAEEAAEHKQEASELSDVVQQVEDGEMTTEDALAQITSDFGPEFAKAVNALFTAAAKNAAKTVDDRLAPVNKTVDGLVAGITDKAERDHYEAIAEAHPDFAEVAEGPDLKKYLESLPEDKRAKETAVVEKGSARQIIKLLNSVKSYAAENNQPETEPEQAPAAVDPAVSAQMDAAAGVRSRGMSIPEKPKGSSDDYESAWADIPD